MNKISSIFYISLIIIISFFIRFHNLSNFYSQNDDLITPEQLIRYENIDIYWVANDKKSPTYNSSLKIKIRKIEKKNNILINQFQIYFSKFIFNMAPIKHSTFAPMQYALFGWMISPDQTYKELKFFSRMPSAIFAFLTIILIYLISKRLFNNQNFLTLYPVLITSISLPLIYISQHSYNYSAASFAFLILILIFLNQFYSKKENFLKIENNKILIFNNIIMSIILVSLAYLNYMLLIITPIFFLYLFVFNFLKIKKIISYFSINLFCVGVFYSILVLPILFHMLKLNLNEYGTTGSTGGEAYEYVLGFINPNGDIVQKSNSVMEIIQFFLGNTYLIISKNLSFFTDGFAYAKILQFLICIFTLFGVISVYLKKNANSLLKTFTSFILIVYVYWCFLTFLNITTLGPTRHLNMFTPALAIFLSYGLYNFIKLFNDNYIKKILVFTLSLFIISIFSLNYKSFINSYEDPFNEARLNELVNKFNINYIVNDNTYSTQLCFMNSIQVKINSCQLPLTFRHNYYPEKFSFEKIQKIKNNGESILLINQIRPDPVIKGSYKEINKDTVRDMELAGFKLILNINEDKFVHGINSPLFISKYKPNIFRLKIYK